MRRFKALLAAALLAAASPAAAITVSLPPPRGQMPASIVIPAATAIQGVAGTASAVTYIISGTEIPAAGAETLKLVGPLQLPSSAAALYTTPASTSFALTSLTLANTSGSSVSGIKVFIGGSAASNQIVGSLTLGAGQTCVYAQGTGWSCMDANGALLSSTIVSLTGDVTGSGASPVTTTIANDAVTNAKLANVATGTFKGRTSASTGDPEDLTGTQATALLDVATTSLKGVLSSADKKKLDGGYKDAVTDCGMDPTGAADATALAQTCYDSFSSTGGRLFFPAGTYLFSSATTVTISKPVITVGAGRSITVLNISHATKTGFTIATGGQGAGFEQIRISAPAAGTRTAGFAIDFGAIANVYVQQIDILFQWSGIHSSGALQFIDDVNIREGGQNAASGQAVLVDSTGDRYVRRLTTDQTNVSTYAGIRVRECSSLVITDSNIIHSGNALDVVPNAGVGHQVASILSVNTFYDTSSIGLNIVPATNNDSVNRVRFINCWFSSMATAGVVLGSASINVANVNSIDFVGCDFYANPVGIDVLGVAEWAVRASRLAGNTTVAIRTAQGLQASVHAFTISDNVIGNVAGFGANGLGINIQAGTYKRYQILDNRGLETNTTKGITDLGVVAATDQKIVANNIGAVLTTCTIGADVVTSGTAQFLLLTCRVPANAVSIGSTYWVHVDGNSNGAGTLAFKLKGGANGTAADADFVTSATSAAQVANHRAHMDCLAKVVTIGSSGTAKAECTWKASNVFLEESAAAAPTVLTINTQSDWFITASVAVSASTFTATTATIQQQ